MANYTAQEILDFKAIAKKIMASSEDGLPPAVIDNAPDETFLELATTYLDAENLEKAKALKEAGTLTADDFSMLVGFAVRENKITPEHANTLVPAIAPVAKDPIIPAPAADIPETAGYAKSVQESLRPAPVVQVAPPPVEKEAGSHYLHKKEDVAENPPPPAAKPKAAGNEKFDELLTKAEKHPVLAGMGLGLAAVAAKAMTGKASFGDIFVFMLIGALAGFVFDKFKNNISADGKYTPTYAGEYDRGYAPRDLPPPHYYPDHHRGPDVRIRVDTRGGIPHLPHNFLGGRGGHGC